MSSENENPINRDLVVGVTSRSFSRHEVLRAELAARFAEVRFNDAGSALKGDDLVSFLSGCDMAITALERIDEALVSRLPRLKVISKYGVGIDMIDLACLCRHGIRLGWQGGVNRRAVSELALAQMICLVRRVGEASREVAAGNWRQVVGGQLSGKTVGIVGLGHIGKDLVQLLAPFGCKVLAHDIRRYDDFCREWHVEQVALAPLLAASDVVTLHVPLDDATRGVIGKNELAAMRPGAFLLNLARGGIVDEGALAEALESGHLGGAAIDVLAIEPPEEGNPLLGLANLLVTPHIGGSTEEAVLAMGRSAIAGLNNPREALPENFFGPLPARSGNS